MAVATLPFLSGFTGSRVFYVRDLGLFFWQRYLWLRRAWLAGDWPLWDPYIGAGQAAVEDALHQMFLFPAALVRLIGSEVLGFNLWVALPFPLAGLGAYLLFARRFSPQASVVGAVAFAVSGPVVSTGNVPNMSWAVAAIPWVLWAVERVAAARSGRRIGVLAFTVAWQAFAGEPVTLFATVGVAAAYALVVATPDGDADRRSLLRHALAVAAGIALGVGLAAVQLIPTAHGAALSERSAVVGQELWSLRPPALVETVWPHLFGDYYTSQSIREVPWMPLMNTGREPLLFSIYLGVPLLALAAVGLGGAGPRRWRLFWVAAGWVGLVSAFGAFTPVLPFLRDHLPLLASFRFPVKYLIVSVMAVAAGAAAGWDALAVGRHESADRRRATRGHRFALGFTILVGGFAATLSVACLYFPSSAAAWFRGYAGVLGDTGSTGLAEFMLRTLPWGASVVVCLSLATAGLLSLEWRSPRWAAMARPGLYVLIVADLVVRAWSVNPVFDSAHLKEPEWLAYPKASPDARFYVGGKREGTLDSFDPDSSRAFINPQGLVGSASRSALCHQAAFYPSAWHVREMLSYDLAVLWPRQFRAASEHFLNGELMERDRFLDRTGVRYRVLPERRARGRTPLVKFPYFLESFLFDWGPGVAPRLSIVATAKVATEDQQIEALFKPDWDTRALVLVERESAAAGDPGTGMPPTARFVSDGANMVVVDATADQAGGYLVLLDSYSDDWRAKVDGRTADLVRANGLFRAVRLTPGRHIVEFAYRPRAFLLGAGISAMVLAVVLVLLSMRRERSFRPGISSPSLPR